MHWSWGELRSRSCPLSAQDIWLLVAQEEHCLIEIYIFDIIYGTVVTHHSWVHIGKMLMNRNLSPWQRCRHSTTYKLEDSFTALDLVLIIYRVSENLFIFHTELHSESQEENVLEEHTLLLWSHLWDCFQHTKGMGWYICVKLYCYIHTIVF